MRTETRKGGAHVRRDTNDRVDTAPVVGTRERFGGLDLPAAFAGTMAALGMLALLGAIATAWFSAYNPDVTRDDVVSPTGALIGLAIVALSCLFGGWVAGRTARYSGAGNGFLTGLLLVLLAAGIGWLIGSADDTSFSMPNWVTNDATSDQAVTTAAIAAAVALLICTLGGALGSFWHRRVDRSLVTETENNAFAPYPEEQRLVTPPRGYEETDETDAVDEPVDEGRTTKARTRRKT